MAKPKRVKSRKRGGGGKLLLLALLLLAAAGAMLMWSLGTPYKGFSRPVTLDIPFGSGTSKIADILAREGVIQRPWLFLAIRAMRPKAALQAGEYKFEEPASAWTVFDRLAHGDIHFYEVTIPEGSNLFDIAKLLEQHTPVQAEDFVKAAFDPSPVRDLDPHAPTLEGYLFPATYRLTKHTTAKRFARDMTERFRQAWKEVQGSGNTHDIVTLASLVEKETAVPAERPAVASVYLNRLERNMKLECDPTTIYAAILAGRYRGVIHRSDLDSMHSYNTYQHKGLPPGPIANPGAKSLSAALRPASTHFIFFVAKPDGSGGHVFSTNIADHGKAVVQYRRGQKTTTGDDASRTPRSGKPGGG